MLCDNCFWKVQCDTYNPVIDIKTCVDLYGGIDYVLDFIENELE